MRSSNPPAQGVRPAWSTMPGGVLSVLEGWLGSAVTTAASQAGGFSPGIAARIRTADGDRYFVKAVGPLPNPDSPGMHRREAQIVAAMPDGVAVPGMLWSHDDDETGWVLLAFQDIDGRHPRMPWRLEELDLVIDGLAKLADSLTPSPLPVSLAGSARRAFQRGINGWRQLAEGPPSDLDRLDGWSRRNLDKLVELESQAPDAVDGDTLLHLDVRADNILLADKKVWIFDWASACVGAPWVDAVGFAPSVAMQGGPPPEQVVARHPSARSADPSNITAAVTSVAGYFTRGALQPPPPGLPTLREFQAAQGAVAREWTAARTGLS